MYDLKAISLHPPDFSPEIPDGHEGEDQQEEITEEGVVDEIRDHVVGKDVRQEKTSPDLRTDSTRTRSSEEAGPPVSVAMSFDFVSIFFSTGVKTPSKTSRFTVSTFVSRSCF